MTKNEGSVVVEQGKRGRKGKVELASLLPSIFRLYPSLPDTAFRRSIANMKDKTDRYKYSQRFELFSYRGSCQSCEVWRQREVRVPRMHRRWTAEFRAERIDSNIREGRDEGGVAI